MSLIKDEKVLIFENHKIEYVKLYDLGAKGCSYLTIAKWHNLKKLNLSIINYYLGENKVEDEGCLHLSKG